MSTDMPENTQLISIALVMLLALIGATQVVACRILGRLTSRIEASMSRMEEEVARAVRQANSAFERIERAAQTSDQLLRDDVATTLAAARSTLAGVESASLGVSDTIEGVQRVVKSVAAVSAPGALAIVTRRIWKRGRGLGMLAFGVGAGLRAFFGDGIRRNR